MLKSLDWYKMNDKKNFDPMTFDYPMAEILHQLDRSQSISYVVNYFLTEDVDVAAVWL